MKNGLLQKANDRGAKICRPRVGRISISYISYVSRAKSSETWVGICQGESETVRRTAQWSEPGAHADRGPAPRQESAECEVMFVFLWDW